MKNNLRKSRTLSAASLRQWLLVVVLACFGTAWAQTPVAQVSNDGTNWTQFEQLITGNSETGAFDCANTLSGDVVIELLLETDASYTLTSGFTFNKSMNSLTLRTQEGVERATITKNQTSASMITVSSSIKTVIVENLIFDGGGDNGNSGTQGGLFNIVSASATFTDCDFLHSKIKNNKTGGAIFYDNSSSGRVYVYGCVFNDCQAPTGTSSGQGNGGAFRAYATSVTIDQSSKRRSSFTDCISNRYGGAVDNETEVSTLSVRHTDFVSCTTSLYDGGAIYSDASSTTIEDCTFTSCSSGRNGGAVVFNVDNSSATCTNSISNSSFTDCFTIGNSGTGYGGAVYSMSSNANLVVSNCTIDGCHAITKGGALYVAGNALKLRNTVSIMDNTINNTYVGNGAGIYMAKASSVIYIEDDNNNGANITVYSNKTSNNQSSDIMTGTTTVPPFQITSSSLTGQIGVANAGTNGLQVGQSTVSYVCGNPIQNVFVDNSGTYPSTEYLDTNIIYWSTAAATPICKITDADGYLLYRGSNGSTDPEAVFASLDYAFAACQGALSRADGTAATPANIEMIVSTCTQYSAVNLSDNTLTLKTASTTPPDNNYPGPESNAVITRGSFTNSMFIMDNSENLTLENITIDGNNVEATNNGGIFRVESSNCHLALNEGTMLRQGRSQRGGAVYVSGNAVFSMSGATIEYCSTTTTDGFGGAIYIGSGNSTANTIENSIFRYCSTTGRYGQSGVNYTSTSGFGGAVCSEKPIIISATADKQTLFDHCSTNQIGGAIYAYSLTLNNNGTISFVDCSGSQDGGGLHVLHGTTINNYSQMSFNNCDAGAGGAMRNFNDGVITINNTGTLTMTGCDASNFGGAIASSNNTTLSITNSGTMSITNCTANGSTYGGGAIYANNGMAIAGTATTPVTISNCTSALDGGGIYSERPETSLSHCTITNCSATHQGGAVYVKRNSLTLGDGVSITGNTLGNTTVGNTMVGNGAGIYMDDENGVIIIVDDGNGANITVYGNTTSDNQPSDIKTGKTVMPFEITATSLTGQIGVANTTISERSLAQSTVSQVLGTPIQNVFVDNCGNYDYIEYKGDDQTLIYWYSNKYHFITAGLWSEAANWQDGIVPYSNVDEIYIEANCQLDQAANVGTLTVTEGTLTLLSGKTLTVNAVLTNTTAEALVIKDGAQLINASPNVAATVEKDITAYGTNNPDGWYTIASPVNTMTIAGSDFLTTKYDLYRFNETNLTHQEWENYKGNIHPDFTTFENGRGYLYANSNTFSPVFVGTLNVAPVTYRLTYTNRPDELDGFNLIGNPFPHNIYKGSGCAISSSYLASGYYTLTNQGAWQVHTDEEAILPGQGILVKTTRSHNLTINKITTSDNSKAVKPRMDISVTGTPGSDRCFFYFCEGIGLNKFNNLDEDAPSLYIRNEGQNYAIAHLNRQTEILDVMFSNKKAGTYTLTIEGNGMNFEYLHLIDNITGADVDLLHQPGYTFHATGNEFAARFKVVFKPMTGVEENQQESFCFVSDEMLYVNMVADGGLLTMTDVLGRVVKSVKLNGNTCSISNLQSGVYIVRLTEGTKSHVQKIVINH